MFTCAQVAVIFTFESYLFCCSQNELWGNGSTSITMIISLYVAVFDESGNFLLYATMLGIKGEELFSNTLLKSDSG